MKIGFYVAGHHGYLALSKFRKDLPDSVEVSFIVTYQTKGLTITYTPAVESIAKDLNAIFVDLDCKKFQRTIPHTVFEDCNYIFIMGWQRKFRELLSNMYVLHDSYLPTYRGFSPTVNALINGEIHLGATLFKPILCEIDAGPIAGRIKEKINYPKDIMDAYDDVSDMYCTLINNEIRNPCTSLMPNRDAAATFSMWRDEYDYFIPWKEYDAQKICRFVHALGSPYLGARSNIKISSTKEIKTIMVFDAEEVTGRPIQDVEAHIGKVYKITEEGNPVIVVRNGFIELKDYYCPGEPNFRFKLRTRFFKPELD